MGDVNTSPVLYCVPHIPNVDAFLLVCERREGDVATSVSYAAVARAKMPWKLLSQTADLLALVEI